MLKSGLLGTGSGRNFLSLKNGEKGRWSMHMAVVSERQEVRQARTNLSSDGPEGRRGDITLRFTAPEAGKITTRIMQGWHMEAARES